MEDLVIDNSKILSYKKGDLNLIHTKTWFCTLRNDLRRLVLKQYDCLDESIYNMKIHEANQMMNFRVHPNLINLLSVWKTDATDSFTYKKIFMLYEDCQFGTFHDFILRDFKKFPRKRILKYFADVSKGRVSSPRTEPPAQK